MIKFYLINGETLVFTTDKYDVEIGSEKYIVHIDKDHVFVIPIHSILYIEKKTKL